MIEQRTSHGDQSDLPKSKSLTLSSPSPKPAADIEEKENFPQTQAEAHISGSPFRVNGVEEPLTPKRINGELLPQATSTPAANGVLYTEQLSEYPPPPSLQELCSSHLSFGWVGLVER